jgi:predicted permease
MMRLDPRDLARQAELRERRSWAYLIISSTMILVVAFGFIWLTW